MSISHNHCSYLYSLVYMYEAVTPLFMGVKMAANYGGYDYSFVEKNLDRFTCNICTKILRDPHLTGCCGQHFCESCLNYWFTKHHKESCPHCRAEGRHFQHLLNKSLKREIESLKIYCINKKKGCQWVGEVGSLKDHLKSDNGCGYVEVECPNACLVQFFNIYTMKRKELENHLKCECYLRRYQCEYCGYNDTYENITGTAKCWSLPAHHYTKCPEFPLKCPNKCCKKDIKRKDMDHHRSQCPEEWVMCSNKCANTRNLPLKCEHVKRKNLSRHLREECELRPYQCKHCGLEKTYIAVKTHYKQCPKFPLECPNKCDEKDIKRKDMEDHRSQCPEEPVQCPFEEAGCKEKLVRRELEQHISTTQQQHLLMVMGAYKDMKKANEELKEELKQELQKTKDEHQQQLLKLSDELAQLGLKSYEPFRLF